MKSGKKENSFALSTRAYKVDLRILRTKKYPLIAKDGRIRTKRVSVPSLDCIFTQMDEIAQNIKQEQIKTTKLQLAETNKFLLDLKEHWKSLMTRLSSNNPRLDDPETPLPSNYNTYLSKQSLIANQIIRMRSRYQLQSKKTQKYFSQLSSYRGRSI